MIVGIHWTGDGESSFAFIYLWVGLYSAYFFSRRQAAGQLALAGATYGYVLALDNSGTAPGVRWVISMASGIRII